MSHALPMLLRAMPMAISGSAHAALIAALIVASPIRQEAAGAQVMVLEVAMVDEGVLASGEASAAPVPETAAPPEVSPPAVAEQASPPVPVVPEVPAFIAPKFRPKPKPPVMAERPNPKVTPREPTPRREAAPTREPVTSPGAGTRRQAGASGSGSGRNVSPGGGLSGAAYAGKVRAILQARANALGVEDQEGSVGLSFVIGASGRMESHAITRTSGSASVDRMIRGMMASSSFPPPPGGRFSGSVTIRIQ